MSSAPVDPIHDELAALRERRRLAAEHAAAQPVQLDLFAGPANRADLGNAGEQGDR